MFQHIFLMSEHFDRHTGVSLGVDAVTNLRHATSAVMQGGR
jgi:hypothetical protein